jgi:formate-dependent nitrite reductase membrane component NrfD
VKHAGLREQLVPLYFHLGGMAAGSYALAGLVTALGGPGADPAARPAFLAAPFLLAACGAILTLHLTRPERFWRVLTRFKWASPISAGAWGLTLLSLASGLTALAVLVAGSTRALEPSWPFRALVFLGGAMGWFVTAYTGVLLSASSRGVWTRTHLLGAVFCVAGLASGAAWMRLLVLPSAHAEAAVAAAKLEVSAGRLTLLSLGLWATLDQRLAVLHEYRQLRARMWLALFFACMLPAALLLLGGPWGPAGAALAVLAGPWPRAVMVAAGEKREGEM